MYVNDAFKKTTGYSRKDVLGRNCRFLQGPDTDPGARKQLRADIQGSRATKMKLSASSAPRVVAASEAPLEKPSCIYSSYICTLVPIAGSTTVWTGPSSGTS